ncbi:hypothetical protein AB0A05_38135 [Streptomyces sp. NPDC046374]|uniref:hypothetical protein n=1 Tax=Streptomyces sp. NPDC046374 TaxID=3154917 RepID=UPI0033C0B78A
MKHHITNRTTTAVLLAAAVVAAATGCGPNTADGKPKAGTSATPAKPKDAFEGLTAEQIDRKTRDTTAAATSVRLNGTMLSGGQNVTLDLALDTHGSCRGRIALDAIGTIDIIKNGTLIYIKGDERYWRTALSLDKKKAISPKKADSLIAALKGRWIKAPQQVTRGLANMCELRKFSTDLGEKRGFNLTRGADTTDHGQPIAVIYQRTDDGVHTIHVAKKGKPYAVRMLTTGSSQPSDVQLSDFDKPVDTTPPPADQILDPAAASV